MDELMALTDRWAEQNRAEMFRTAYLASVLINVHRDPRRPPVTPQQLMGEQDGVRSESEIAARARATLGALAGRVHGASRSRKASSVEAQDQ